MSGEWDSYPSRVQRLLFMWHHLVLASVRSSVRCTAIIWDDCAVLWITGVSERLGFFVCVFWWLRVREVPLSGAQFSTEADSPCWEVSGCWDYWTVGETSWCDIRTSSCKHNTHFLSFFIISGGSLCLFSFSLYLTVRFVHLSHIHPHKDKHINKYIHCIKPHTWEPACHTGWRGHSQRSSNKLKM